MSIGTGANTLPGAHCEHQQGNMKAASEIFHIPFMNVKKLTQNITENYTFIANSFHKGQI